MHSLIQQTLINFPLAISAWGLWKEEFIAPIFIFKSFRLIENLKLYNNNPALIYLTSIA